MQTMDVRCSFDTLAESLESVLLLTLLVILIYTYNRYLGINQLLKNLR